MVDERYQRNIPAISEEEQGLLGTKTVAILGCGGLGGHLIEAFSRLGVKGLKLVDCDEFSKSNLNRQLLSNEANMGKRKVLEAKERALSVNSSINIEVFDGKFTAENAKSILSGADIVVDALDNVDARFAAQDACEELGLYFVHGAIGGWRVQASTIAPGSKTLDKIFQRGSKTTPPSVLAFTPDLAASVEISEALKVLLGKHDTLEGKLFMADLETNTFTILDLQ